MVDTVTPATVDLTASTVNEGSGANYVFTATLSNASEGVTTIHTDQGDISIADGATTGILTIASGNGEDVYNDASSLTAHITGVSGGNFESLTVGTGTATANVVDTVTPATVDLTASTVNEGSGANYVFTATLSNASEGVTTIHTDQGDISIADGATTGILTIASGNGEDVYNDASSLTAHITGVSGGNFESLTVGTGTATANVVDTVTPATVDLTASTVNEGSGANYVFTATLSNASEGVTTIHTDQGDISIADGATTGILTIASGNGEDVYNDASSLTAHITGVSGGNFESLTVGTGTATANVVDTVTPATVDLTASTVNEGSGANYVFTATLSNASEGVTTIHTDQGDISIADGATTGILTIASGNGEDVYNDASSLTAHITGVSGGNFESLTVGTGTATANVVDTVTPATVDLTASTVNEGSGANYVFTATLSNASEGVTTIHTDQGDISIADGATTGILTIASGNGEDVYNDASSLTAHITGVSGGNFESLTVGTGTATANVVDTVTPATVDLTASTVNEGSGANYVFTATLSNASEGVTTIHTDQGDISIADGATTGILTIASGNGEDVYNDASSLTAHITGVSGGNFESLTVGTGTATANVVDTVTPATVDLTASTVNEGSGANYVFTATLSNASEGVTTIHTDQGDISIADGATTGILTIASGNGEDVYNDASSLTAHITGVSGGNFESLTVGTGTATANVVDTVTPATVDLTASTVNEGSGANYVFTATLSNASEGVTTIHTDQGDISIADGATTGILTIASGNGEDVYNDASSLTAHITGVSGGNFESLTVGTGTATANVVDTVTPATVDLTASTVNEGSGANYVFTATLSNASEGVTTIHTDQGDISIADGATTGILTIASGNGEDVYNDASSLTAHITGVSGGNFESLTVGTGTATANVVDTVTPATVDLTASTVNEGSGANYVFTATLSNASEGVTTIHTDQGDISIADGATTGILTIASGNGEDVYNDASSLTAHITGVSGGNFESLTVGTGTATANVVDTVTPATVDLTASTVNEGSGANYVFTATLSNASEGVTTIHTDQGDISIADGATTGILTIASGNGEDVYNDASSLTAHITGVSGGNFESLTVGTGTATANVVDTVTPATVDLTASTVNEGSGANYVFTATLSNASEGVTTIHTDQGDISIADGATTGILTIASGNGEDVYNDASSLTAHITGVSGGNFESLTVGTGTATANVVDTVTPATVDLTASTVNEGSGANYVFTATLSNASEGVTTIHTDQGDISIADGATTGILTIASGNGEDVYNDASSLTAHITGVSGGNFESLTVGTGTATANVVDTVTPATVDLTASTVNEGSGANYVFTATLSNASEGVTTIHTDQGDISIADGATTGILTIASGNGEDVYNDASSLTAHITGVSGGNFESLTVGTGTATANVVDTVTPATVDLTASTVNEGSGANYVFTATLSNASEGVTTIHTDQGDISIADGATTGILTIASGNGEDVYNDASSLTAHITGVSGGNFESLTVGTGTATANVVDTVTPATVDLTASTVNEGSGANYVFTATLSNASEGVTTIHTDQGDISIADGATTGILTIASGNGEDVYNDASSLTAHITGVSGGNFESLTVGTGTATANVVDTVTPATVDLTASTVNEGSGANYVFTATLSNASEGVTTIHTDQGDISIADGATTGILTIASGNGEDVYNDASSLTAHITGVSGGNFESLTVGTGTATANVVDTVTPATVDLTASTVNEGSGANYVFTATLSNASEGVTTIHTDQGDISIADGATTGILTIASGNGEDVYNDASSLTAHITGVSGGNFESLTVGTGTATANVVDTVTPATVDLTASTVNEGSGANYVFTATLSNASEGVTTIHTDQGDISIADGATTGILTIASGNGEDVYNDASSLTAHITGVSGGNFESLTVGTGTATANVVDTVTPATVDLTASTVNEGSGANYVFTATLSNASEGVTTIHTDQGDISIADGATTGILTIASGNGEDVYNDASSLTAHITGVSGGNFESLTVGTGTATANVVDTVTPATVTLDDALAGSTPGTATIAAHVDYAVTGSDLLLNLSNGATITIAVGATSGTSAPFVALADATIAVSGTSGGNFEALVTSDTSLLSVNNAPVNTVPGAQTIAEDTDLVITGLSISDVDAGSATNITTTLSVVNGTLTVASASGAAVSGSGTGSVTLTGSITEINTTLAAVNNVVYRGVADFNGNDTLTITTNDHGNTGIDPGLSGTATSEQDTDTVSITVTAVNDAPVATITPVSYAATEQTSLTLKGTGLSISDVDAGSGSMTVTLAVAEGTLNVTAGTSGAVVTNSGTSSVTITGTVAQINNLLTSNATSTVSYIDNTDTPSASSTLTLTVHDNGNTGTGGDLVSVATSTINITAVNDAPVATITPVSYAATEQTSLTLKGTGLSISDVDAGSGSMTVTLAVAEGTLNVTAGTSGAVVTNSGTSSVTITGTVAQINNLLTSNATSTVSYIDNTDTPSASSTLTLTVHDNGNTGTGGDLVSVATSTINITAVNDAPVATITPVSYAATEQTSLTLKGTGLSISDVDAGSGSMTVTLAVAEGTLNVTAGTSGAVVTNSGTSSVTITGTVAQINNLLTSNATSTVSYIDNTDTPSASSTLTLTVHDNGNTGTGGDLVSVATSTINITAVNDAPVATITPVSYAATEQTSLTLKGTGLSISDVDAGSGSMTVTLAVAEGTLNVTAGTSGAVVTNSGTSSVTITGTVAQINNLLTSNATSTVSYIDNTDTPSASSTLTLTVHDNGNTGTGGDLVSVATSTINITAVNDPPVFAATGSTLTVVTNAGASNSVSFTEAALAAYFTDPDSATIGINTVATASGLSSVTGTGLGAANLGTIGTITITDDATLSGSFAMTATDGSLASAVATVTFTDNTTGTLTLNAAASGNSIIINKSTTGATMTGGAGSDYFIGGSGNDTIVGAQNDKLFDGGAGTDTLSIGANFTSTSDAQIVNIENVTLTAGVALNLTNQTEGFTITGSSSANSITAGSGNDTIIGAQNDTLLDGGAGTDTLKIGANFTSTSDAQIVNIENITLTAASTLNLSNQTEGFTITGSAGIDSITAGSGNDTIVGAQNDTLLDGGAGTDTLNVGANFTSTSDAQIANIENVTLTASGLTLNLSNQTEGFTITALSGANIITGGSGADTIHGGTGNDTIVGAQNDILLDGGAGTDTLNVGANFTSTSDAQIVNIENVTLTASVTLDLSNQTEGFNITGSSGADTIIGGSGNDTITGGAGADTMTGGAGADRFVINTGDSTATIGGSNNAGTITGYDVITDFATASDTLDLQGTAAAAANTAGTNGTQSSLQIGSQTIKSHAISNGIVTFSTAAPYSAGLSLTSTANVAAVVDYLSKNDIGTTGTTVAFTATLSSVAHTFVYEQLSVNAPASSADYLLVDLSGVTLTSGGTSVTSLISAGRIAPAGVAGEPINLALAAPADHVGAVAVTISGVPAGWSLSEGSHNADGSWTVHTDNVAALTITSPADYAGAIAFHATMSWTNADGSSGIHTFVDNVEAYAAGNPIFALAGDDNLTGSAGNDLMVFGQPISHDVVYNFDVAHDQIDLLGFAGATSFAEVSAHLANDAHGNAELVLGDGTTITFAGVDAGGLSASNFVFDQEPVTTNSGNMVLSNGSILPLSGVVENTGTITLDSTGAGTEIQIVQHGITLEGGGSLRLSDSSANVVNGTSSDVVFTNIDNTISGAGHLGEGQLTLVNHGTIIASGANALEIDTGANVVFNSGTLEATGTGGLAIDSNLWNTGVLWANNGNITVEGNVSGDGSAVIDGVAAIELGGLFAETITIDPSAAGTLVFDHAGKFSGAVVGFNDNDQLHLTDIAAVNATLNYTPNAAGTGGILSVSDGTHTANIQLQGQYAADDFHSAADPTGGTSIVYVAHNEHVV